MSYFIAGILRIILLEASVALLVVGRLAGRDDVRTQRRIDVGWRVLAVLALFSWTNFGQLRGSDRLVHRWEQYHFFFGSKYLPEIGYFNLYKATILADRETTHILGGVRRTRDLTSFDEQSVDEALTDATAVRAAFSDARWAAFKADWSELARSPVGWTLVLDDHGNSGSPAWALFAAPIARVAGIGPTGQMLMGLVDQVLMVVLFGFVFYAFGLRPGCLALVIWALVPFCFDYLAGSLLRWDWLFALGMCLVCWRLARPLAAGAFLGYAIASKLFPLFFGVAFAVHHAARLWRAWRHRRAGERVALVDRRLVRFAAGAALAMVLAVALSSAMFGGLGVWRGYRQRIAVAQHERYYPNQYSFRTVFLQVLVSTPAEFASTWMAPREIKQARRDVFIGNYRGAFLAAQLALSALLCLALVFADELEALAVGPLFVYVWLVVNAYYWNMLALPALAWALRETQRRPGRLAPLIWLHVLLGWFYLYQHLGRGFSEGYFVGLLMLVLIFVWAASAIYTGVRTRSRLESA